LGASDFVNLEPAQARIYVNRWFDSRFKLMRDGMVSLRGIILFTYFSDKNYWNYLGYDPRKHAQERMQLRDKLIRRDDRQKSLEEAMAHAKKMADAPENVEREG
jgi:hypothetical protein